MNLIINGQQTAVPNSIGSVEELLEHFGLQDKQLVVELNRTILQKDEHAAASVKEGSLIEIVHFVGGG